MLKTRPKICLLILGGTVLTEEEPDKNAVVTERDLKPWLAKMPEINLMAEIEPIFIVGEKEKEPKLEHWIKGAKLIAERIKTYDGFVVTHHPYSLLYAASAFAFMLQGLPKPVVFTGSQIPLPFPIELAKEESFKRYKGLGIKANLINALQVAIQGPSEVTIMFGNKIVRATQAIQAKSLSLNLFDAPAEATIGLIDFGIKISDFHQKIPKKSFTVNTKFDPKVSSIPLYPSVNKELIERTWQKHPSAILVQCQDPEISQTAIKKILKPKADIPIVLYTTIPFLGKEQNSFYVVENTTFETAFIKLMWILGQTKDKKQIGKLLKTNLVGEFIAEGE